MPSTTDETRARRRARQLGLRLTKSRQRAEQSADHGTYWLCDPAASNVVLLGGQFGTSLADVADFLESR